MKKSLVELKLKGIILLQRSQKDNRETNTHFPWVAKVSKETWTDEQEIETARDLIVVMGLLPALRRMANF